MFEIANGSVGYIEADITVLNGAFFATPDSVLSAIGGELIFDGLTIANKNVHVLSALAFPLTGEFTATLQILNQSGQELDDTDMTAQFIDAANTQTTFTLQVNSAPVTQVVGPQTGVNTGTGSQGNVQITGPGAAANVAAPGSGGTPAVHQCGDPTWSGWSDPIQYIKCLTQGGLTTIGILAIGLLIGVVLIVATQNRPRVTV